MTDAASRYLRGLIPPPGPVSLSEKQLFGSLDATYAAVGASLAKSPDRWGGWKLGGSNHASRKAFGVSELYYGALAHEEILTNPDHAPCADLYEVKGEVEIALRIAPDGQGYDAWCVALEMPSSPIANLLECGVRALVADRCAAGVLLLGPVSTGALPPLDQAVLTLEQDAETLDSAGLGSLTAPPEQQLKDFLDLSRAHGVKTRPGDWVATGGITRCCDFSAGARVRVLLDGAVQLDVEITRGPGT